MDRASEIAVSMEEGSPPGEQQALAPKNPNKNQGAPPKHHTLKRAASMRGAQKQKPTRTTLTASAIRSHTWLGRAAFFSLVAGVKKLLGELESKVRARVAPHCGAEEHERLADLAFCCHFQVHGKNADPPSLKIIFFGDVLAFDEEKKRDLIEERTDEIQALIKQAKLKLEEMLQEASVRR
jgi:hypothetical protein